MNFFSFKLKKPMIICGHVHNKPPPIPKISLHPPSHLTQTGWEESLGKQTAPVISSSFSGAVAAGTPSKKASKDFCPFHTFFSKWLWQNIWEWKQVQMQKKKKCLWIMEHFKSIWFLRHFLVSHYSQLYSTLEWELVLSWGSVCFQISTLIVATNLWG